jgi:hypothetical protein
VAACWELDGEVDAGALHQALHALALRHEAFRRCFPLLSDEPTLARVDRDVTVPLRVGEADPRSALMTPFDARVAPLWRVELVRRPDGRSILGFSADHLICDGLSMGILLKELTTAYDLARQGRTIEFARPAPAYSDFATRQRDGFGKSWGRDRRAFWTDQVRRWGRYPPECGLAVPEYANEAHSGGVLVTVSVDAESKRHADGLARRWGITRFALTTFVVLSAIAQVLENSRVGLSLDIHGRLLPGASTTIGLFAHGVPLNVDLPPAADTRIRALAVSDALAEMLTYGLPLRGAGPNWGMELSRSHDSTFLLLRVNSAQWANGFRLGDVAARVRGLQPVKADRIVKSPGMLDLEVLEYPDKLVFEAHFDQSVYSAKLIQFWLDRVVDEFGLLAAL